MDAFARDVRYALRQLRRSPGFAIVAVVTIALGIAATTAAYSAVTISLARRIPVRDVDRVVGLWSLDRSTGQALVVSAADFVVWRERQQSFEAVAAQRMAGVNLSGLDQPSRVTAAFVSASYFDVVGVSPVIGRAFTVDENAPGRADVAIASDRFWRRQFGGHPIAVGQTVLVDDRATTIVGVMPPDDFSPDLFLPLAIDPHSSTYQQRALRVAARLRPGVSIEMARAAMSTIASQLARELPESHEGWGIVTRPYRVEFIAPGEEVVLALLGLAAIAVLMIGCANVASLLLARGAARMQEMVIRSALGATRSRLIRQTFLEGLVLAAAGSILGILLAIVGLRLLVRFAFPNGAPAFAAERPFLNVGLLTFTVGATVCSALLFAVIPALHHSRADAATLGAGGRRTDAHSRQRLRSVLVAGEVAGTVVLLAIATLFLRTAANLDRIEPGFDTRNLLLLRVALPEAANETASGTRFFDGVVERLNALPGVVSAGAAQRVPVEGNRLNPNRTIAIEGRPASAGESRAVDDLSVTAGYLETLRVQLRAGRLLRSDDAAGAPLVVVVSDTTARRYWGQRSPIGAQIRLGDEPSASAWRTVVGVVSDVRNDDIDTPPPPSVYVPAAQRPAREMTFLVRTVDDPLGHVTAARRAVAAEDPNVPIYNIRSMDQLLAEDLQGMAVLSSMTTAFAALALLLATVGIYGLLSYNVAQRTREIAVRIAVGAQAHHVIRHVLGRGLGAVLTGIATGLLAAIAVSRLLKIVLYGVSPSDPSTYVVVACILAGAALVACAVPTQRVLRLNPVVALRTE